MYVIVVKENYETAAMRVLLLVSLSFAMMLANGLLRAPMCSKRSLVRFWVTLNMGVDSDGSSRKEKRSRGLIKKYTQQDLKRSADGVPVEAVKAARPLKYGTSGGSGGKRIMNQGSAREKEIINPNRLKILGGKAKGKKIDSPDVYLRPMMGKVKEALYSTLNHIGLFDTNTTRVLDTFAGSGSVGLEALSRGACHTTFVDLAEDCTKTAMRNAANCGFDGQANAVCARAEEVIRNPEKYGIDQPFGLITLTPPYEEVIYQELIDALCNSPAVTEDTIVVIEYPVEMGNLPYILGGDKFFGLRNRRYGRTILALYVHRPSRQYDARPEEFS